MYTILTTNRFEKDVLRCKKARLESHIIEEGYVNFIAKWTPPRQIQTTQTLRKIRQMLGMSH